MNTLLVYSTNTGLACHLLDERRHSQVVFHLNYNDPRNNAYYTHVMAGKLDAQVVAETVTAEDLEHLREQYVRYHGTSKGVESLN